MIKVIIIDDEAKARESLKKTIISYCPELTILACGNNVEDAITLINQHVPDIVFLDIEMPNGNGFSLFEKFKNPAFTTIFTSAYEEYAIKAFRIEALDYLNKPIDFRQLQEAVGRFKNKRKIELKEQRLELLIENMTNRSSEFNKIALPDNQGYIMVKTSDILYCQADSSYTIVHLINGKKIITSKILKLIEELLPKETFYRIHKSYIVNLNLIKQYVKNDGNHVLLENDVKLDVSDRNKKEFLEKLLQK
jgi:two-component system LytT family response regulator